ncbi:MAG: NAD(P)H-dependent oxidoreductase [Lachnospiraceae bacterium]|nr:NAD(P)H-dependent oxidoreductase [Lachnospiraceae bacterium]
MGLGNAIEGMEVKELKALVMNCSPVRNGATAEIVNIVSACLEKDMIQEVSVSPSYWADIPGQFKAFIDRCTPWCNTHEPHAVISSGKKGYAIALRTGPGMQECNRIVESIEYFYGQKEIATMKKSCVRLLSRNFWKGNCGNKAASLHIFQKRCYTKNRNR